MLEELKIGLTCGDRILILTEMSWSDYERLATDNSENRISYLNNIVTIVSPSRNHERITQTIAILINAYCRKYKIPYFALGSKDIRQKFVAGKQPDASYCFLKEKEPPDLAVEVNYTSGSLNDLEKYQLLDVPEVWVWQNDIVTFYQLENGKYIDRYHSLNLPKLRSDFLNQYVNRGLIEDNLTIETDFFAAI